MSAAPKAQLELPPPKRSNPVTGTLAFQRSPLDHLSRLFAVHGDLARFRLLNMPVIAVSHPHHVRRVLRDNHANYDKDSITYRMVRTMFGDGLITSIGGQEWLQRRRLVQPLFHRDRIAGFGETIVETVDSMLDRWDSVTTDDRTLDVGYEMSHLTLQIVARSLFDQDPESDTLRRFTQAVRTLTDEMIAYVRRPLLPLRVPTPGHRRFWHSLRTIDEIVYDLIHQYAAGGTRRPSLLSMMMAARDQDTGEAMTDVQLRNETFGMLFAGHETSSSALTWVWYLLAHHEEVERRLHEELDTVLDGRRPTMDDMPRLPYTRMVIDETLRLYPSGWQTFRHARADDEIGGKRIPAGSEMLLSLWHMHRKEEFWVNAGRFDPERFRPERVASQDRDAYAPFGEGGRICVGQHFALAEIQLAVVAIAQRYRLVQTPKKVIQPKASVTLTTAEPVVVSLRART